MKEIQYIGEHILPGRVGHYLIILSTVAAIFGAISFYLYNRGHRTKQLSYSLLGLHVSSTLAAIVTLFYIVLNRYYEYHYAYKVANDTLPFKYIFSGFWQDQEGSFLLWMFWHCVVLVFLSILHKSEFKNIVLATILGVEALIASMLLGIYVPFLDLELGVDPFVLLRQTMDIPLFANADYLSLITGQGLNPLLQNYWNIIHPPTLFLGFASAIIPFAFAISGLLNKNHTEWMKQALPYTLWAAAILGTGILMGSAWAYEALSFGGYWAWDPVENSSLVPWILQVTAIHAMIVAIKTKRNIGLSYIVSILSFFMVLYSTFLTRSGVLGDTSVHAFTQMGLESQLLFVLFSILIPSLWLIWKRRNDWPKIKTEENLASREFWMFLGIVILLLSSILITFTTSIPVFNKILDFLASLFGSDFSHLHRTAPVEPIVHYNKYQIWIAIFVAVLSAIAQWLRYKEFNIKKHYNTIHRHVIFIMVISVTLFSLIAYYGSFGYFPHLLMLYAAVFGMVANLDYLLFFLKQRKKSYGSVLSHFGFSLMLVGILFTGVHKRFLQNNAFLQAGIIPNISSEEIRKNVLLFESAPMIMENYELTYISDSLDQHNRYFNIRFRELDKNFNVKDSFNIKPHIIYTKNFDKVAASNPFSVHFWNKDLFAYISKIPTIDPENQRLEEDSLNYTEIHLGIGDTLYTEDGWMMLDDVYMDHNRTELQTYPGDILFEAHIKYKNTSQKDRATSFVSPAVIMRGNTITSFPERMNKLSSKIKWSDSLWVDLWKIAELKDATELTIRPDEQKALNGITYKLIDVQAGVSEEMIDKKEGDIGLTAFIRIEKSGIFDTLEPVFLHRNGISSGMKSYSPRLGVHMKFINVNPSTGALSFQVLNDPEDWKFPFLFAEGASRKDYIVLQVSEFPQINLFWIGSIIMLLGLFYGSWIKNSKGS